VKFGASYPMKGSYEGREVVYDLFSCDFLDFEVIIVLALNVLALFVMVVFDGDGHNCPRVGLCLLWLSEVMAFIVHLIQVLGVADLRRLPFLFK
jgi:hypothetical protein